MALHDTTRFDLGELDPGFRVQFDGFIHPKVTFDSLKPQAVVRQPIFRLIREHIDQSILIQFQQAFSIWHWLSSMKNKFGGIYMKPKNSGFLGLEDQFLIEKAAAGQATYLVAGSRNETNCYKEAQIDRLSEVVELRDYNMHRIYAL
jgi:hypothetical protein